MVFGLLKWGSSAADPPCTENASVLSFVPALGGHYFSLSNFFQCYYVVVIFMFH